MGLEHVELVMEIEEEFGITISDEDAPRIPTVGVLAHYVEHRLYGRATPLPKRPHCVNARVFYALRRTIVSTLGLGRASLRPKVRLSTLVRYSARAQLWRQLERDGLKVPPLRVPVAVQFAVIAFAGLVGFCLLLGQLHYQWPTPLVLAWIPIACGIAVFVLRRSDAFVPTFTLGDLARQTWLDDDEGEPITLGESSDPQVLDRVVSIVANQIGRPKSSIGPETRFSDIWP